jgi:hypothetical protein
MIKRSIGFGSIVAIPLALTASIALVPADEVCAQQATLSYSEDIEPIFRGWCMSCHQPGGEGFEASGLDLTTYEGLMKGTKLGPMVIPGEPDFSSLISLLSKSASEEIRMPFKHKALPNCLRRNVWTWIFQGAKDN